MSQGRLDQAPRAGLRWYVGQRVNLFRAMYTPGVFLGDDRSVLALRDGHYALTARIGFDVLFECFYVRECHWYRSDLTRADDEQVPDGVRQNLLRRFLSIIG